MNCLTACRLYLTGRLWEWRKHNKTAILKHLGKIGEVCFYLQAQKIYIQYYFTARLCSFALYAHHYLTAHRQGLQGSERGFDVQLVNCGLCQLLYTQTKFSLLFVIVLIVYVVNQLFYDAFWEGLERINSVLQSLFMVCVCVHACVCIWFKLMWNLVSLFCILSPTVAGHMHEGLYAAVWITLPPIFLEFSRNWIWFPLEYLSTESLED